MSESQTNDSKLLEQILSPLLDDYRYWFGRSQELLESQRLNFLSVDEQSALLQRVKQVQQEVAAATTLFHLSDKQAGIDVAAMMPWHQLLMEMQSIGMRYRQQQQE